MPTIDQFLPTTIQNIFFSGYTVLNTLIYGIILIIILFLILKLFNHLKINPKDIIYSLIPFIFFGTIIRALVDNNIYPKTIFLITPGIYFLVGILAITSLLIGYYLNKTKNLDYRYTIFLIGLTILIIPLSKIPNFNINSISLIIIVWLILTISFYILGKKWKLYNNKLNLSILSAHLLDASSTFVAVDYLGYYEQHVLPNFIHFYINTAATMIPLKIIVISFALYITDKYIDDENINGLLKLTIFVLGLAPGLRNIITIAISSF
ncbi:MULTISPECIES: DUF63 family protein [unclassified Methanobrevibacter]|jgi:uncharacterized membrane protein|uniref:DUF63 family protein n=1 Tax=unclassified Methanobrevibacter TaxID=2638681 RepID=UPI0039B8F3A4